MLKLAIGPSGKDSSCPEGDPKLAQYASISLRAKIQSKQVLMNAKMHQISHGYLHLTATLSIICWNIEDIRFFCETVELSLTDTAAMIYGSSVHKNN